MSLVGGCGWHICLSVSCRNTVTCVANTARHPPHLPYSRDLPYSTTESRLHTFHVSHNTGRYLAKMLPVYTISQAVLLQLRLRLFTFAFLQKVSLKVWQKCQSLPTMDTSWMKVRWSFLTLLYCMMRWINNPHQNQQSKDIFLLY